MKVILLVIGIAFCVNAQNALVVPPEKSKPVVIPKFDKPPVIDGKLDEEVWQKAVVLKDFYQIQPGDNTPPSKPTEVLLGFDPKFLYIAFKATDEPDKIRATIAKRDNIWQDDYVGVMLDTFNDKRKAFEVFFNPHGIQGDGILTEGRGRGHECRSVDGLQRHRSRDRLRRRDCDSIQVASLRSRQRKTLGRALLPSHQAFRK